MKICILGGSGFIGKTLAKMLIKRGDTVIILTRTRHRESKDSLLNEMIAGQTLKDQQQCLILSYFDAIFPKIGEVDVLINLAGAPISDHLWTAREKKQLVDSRIQTTKYLLTAVHDGLIKPKLLISGSAIGYYGDRGRTPLSEDMDSGDGFLSDLAQLWEDTALSAANEMNLPTAIIRTGIVLGHGGFLDKIISTRLLGIYTQLGKSQAYLPWIHIEDCIQAILYIIDMNLTGIFNLCAPNPVTHEVFMRTLKACSHSHYVVKIPENLVKYGFGDFSQLFLYSQNAKPVNLLENGFRFNYKKLDPALKQLLR